MSLSCQPRKPQPSLLVRKEQQTKRDLGLSPVFNVNTGISPCLETFVSPTYDCDNGMCEPVTGLTIGCPDGYIMTCGSDICIKETTTGATATVGSGTTITTGDTNTLNDSLGAYFFENVQDREYPIYRDDPFNPDLRDNTGGTITATNIVTDDAFWDSDGSTTQGRLNLSGMFNNVSEFRGVSYCFEECSATTYYIGYGTGGGSGTSRLTIDGELIIDTDSNINYDSYIWNVIPWEFTSGKHIIEYEINGVKSSAMEVYKPINGLGQLTGATTSGDTGVVFSTSERIGTTWDLGVTAGYTCPTGYSMDNCGTGLTCTLLDYTDTTYVDPLCLHNLSEVSEFDITFNFSGGSTMYTGYTGEFCYSLINSLSAAQIPYTCVPYDEITGNSITRTLDTTEISSVDNSYRVRSWDVFESKCANTRVNDYVIGDGVDDDDKFRLVVDTSQYVDTDNDCYFVTVTNPPAPRLEFVPVDALDGITFVNSTLPSPIEGSNQVMLDSTPIGGEVQLTVNGLTVSQTDFNVDSIDTRLITLLNGITFEETDVVSAIYNTSIGTSPSGVVNNVKLEFFSVTGITTGTTSSVSASTYENIVNYNDVNDRLEIFLKDKIDPGVQPRLTINGVNLAFNVDFFKSNKVQNKLILNEGSVIEVGDAISIYYYYTGINNPGDLGIIQTDTPRIDWTSQQNILRSTLSWGDFIVEIADRDDPSFSNILKTATTVYNNVTSSYTLNVGPITTKSVSDYIYRIKFIKNFVTSNPINTYTTQSYSDTGSFRLDWAYINNTNF